MSDFCEFCDCYHRDFHQDELVPYACDFCEKMERMFLEETEDSEKEIRDEEHDVVTNF